MTNKALNMLTAGDFCCGLGGSSNAAEKVGIPVSWGIDIDADAINSYQHMVATPSYQMSVEELEARAEILPDEWKVNILMVTPPCQGFTLANTTGSEVSRFSINQVFHRTGRVIELLYPEVAIIENVPGLLSVKHEADLASFTCHLQDEGYTIKYGTFHTNDFNVPQKRRRVIMYASAPGIKSPDFLSPKTFIPSMTDDDYNVSKLTSGLLPVPTLREALSGLGNTSSTFPYNHHIESKKIVIADEQILDWNGVAPTVQNITSQWRKGHPDGERVLSVREAARLQTLPDGLEICGSKSSQYRQVGNSTPPDFFKEFLIMVKEAILSSRAENNVL